MVGSERKSRPCFNPCPPTVDAIRPDFVAFRVVGLVNSLFSLGVEKSARFGSRDVPSLSARWWAMITGGARVWKGETSADSANVAGF